MASISSVTSVSSDNTASTSQADSPIAKTSDSSLALTAVNLASAGSIVSILGNTSSPLTYDAAGLLNSLIQAESGTTDQTATSSSTPTDTQNSTDQGAADTSTSTPSVYDASGVLQALPSDTTTNWANILKTNPGLSSIAIADSFNQGIVGTLSTTA